MKLKTNILVSVILALIITGFISKNFIKDETTLESLLKKTELVDLEGIRFNKKTLKHKVVILSFFQTWCGDCAREQPDLVQLQDRFGDSLCILLISDEPVEKIKAFKEKFKCELHFYHTDKALKKEGIATKFPTTYLMDKKGKMKLLKVEGIHWYTPEIVAMIEQMLAR